MIKGDITSTGDFTFYFMCHFGLIVIMVVIKEVSTMIWNVFCNLKYLNFKNIICVEKQFELSDTILNSIQTQRVYTHKIL